MNIVTGCSEVENSNKIILDLCGGTGSWSKFYKEAGYDVRLITLPEFDVTKIEFGTHAMDFIKVNKYYPDDMCVLYEDVYGILAAPPCTEFSVAKGNKPRDFKSALKIVKACQEIIWQCRLHKTLKFWAMENPRGFLRQFLGVPQFTFEQWQFGNAAIKTTDIWGYYNIPKQLVKEKPSGLTKLYPCGTTNSVTWEKPECPEEYKHLNLNRAALRAITPPGFAKAFYKANR